MNTYGKHSSWSASSEEDQAAASDPGYGDQAQGDPGYAEPGHGEPGYAEPGNSEPGYVDAAGGSSARSADDVVVVEPAAAGASPAGDAAAASNVNGSPASTVGDGRLAGAAEPGGALSGTAASPAEWSEIKALFVDDPSDSVQRASALVERAVQGFMASLRQRQDSLRTWHEGDAAGTEELRKALRGYRGLLDQLEQMSGQFASSGVSQASASAALPSQGPGASTASASTVSAGRSAGAAAPDGGI